MSWKATSIVLLALVGAAGLLVQAVQRPLAGAWFAFGVHPDVLALLDASLDDQKRLARLDPAAAAGYRARFDRTQALLARLRILEHNRQEIVDRYELALLSLVGGLMLAGGTGWALRQARQEARLGRLQRALQELAAGRADVAVGERRRDLVGRIAAMVEEASRVMARDRRRLASLENLSAWQDAARRHAHEMKTPLTAARLELARLGAGLERELDAPGRAELARIAAGVVADLDRLGRFTQGFTSFARLPAPEPVPQDLAAVVAAFARLFADAWPNLELRVAPSAPVPALVDAEMLRQVLVNLCDNSSLAMQALPALPEIAERRGTVTFTLAADPAGAALLDVADDGPGVPEAVRARLFEPYTTTRAIGQGMGLGLAISRKILLDHGGDLELVATSAAGTVFRLAFPRSPAA